MGSDTSPQLPKIDFSGVNPASAGTESWNSVRAQVIQAMESHGCFEAIYPQVTPEIRESLLGTVVKELFALPLETKHRNIPESDKHFNGYLGQIPGLEYYESLAIADAPLPHATQSFANLMWPDTGNPTFCETVLSFSNKVAELEGMARRMLMEGLGVDKYYEDHTKSTWYALRFSEYRPPAQGEEKKLGYLPHRDTNTMSIVCQLQKDGLEVQAKDGEWMLASPSPISFIVLAGNCFRAWSNGRVGAALHRILVGGDAARYSVILFSAPKGDILVEAPPELVDEEHPRLCEPYNYDEFVLFSVSEERKTMDTLTAYSKFLEARKAEA